MTAEKPHVLVIGAGVAGSACAGALREKGHRVTHVDKGRNPGGRLATRLTRPESFPDGVFEVDHGCPSFAVKGAPLGRQVDSWVHWGHAGAWSPRTRHQDSIGSVAPSLIGLPRMNSLAVALSGARPTLNQRVESLERVERSWFARDAEGSRLGPFDATVVAVPAPQAERLLSPAPALAKQAGTAKMLPVWSLLVGFKTRPSVMFERWESPAPGLSLIIDNTSKAGREERSLVSAWVVHATPEWSYEHLESSPEHIESLMVKQTLKLLKTDTHQLCYAKAHRWRYARVDQACSSDGYLWDADNQIGSCGDWCLGDGVEAAMTSGWRLARQMS